MTTMNNQGKIVDLKSLHREKDRLYMMSTLKKDELENRYLDLRNNYKRYIWNAINPLKDKTNLLSQLFSFAKKNIVPAVVGMDASEAGSDVEILGLLVMKLIAKLKRKKTPDAEQNTE